MDHFIFQIIWYIGMYAPILLILISLFVLRNKAHLLLYFILGLIINLPINVLLKHFFREPRPLENKEYIDSLKTHHKLIHFDRYGMPSGHAQYSSYCIAFLLFSLGFVNVHKYSSLFLLCFFVFVCTLYQRYFSKSHTILQLVAGTVLGSFLGYVFFSLCVQNRKMIQGELGVRSPRKKEIVYSDNFVA